MSDTGWPTQEQAEQSVRACVERGKSVPGVGRRKLATLLTEYDARSHEIERLQAQLTAVRALCERAMRLPTPENPAPASDFISPRAVLSAMGDSRWTSTEDVS